MSYFIMECHPGYAVALDQDGRFLKVANLNYEVGQMTTAVVELKGQAKDGHKARSTKRLAMLASMAACLCMMALASWKFMLTPYGTIRMQINPDVQIHINRMNYVIGLEGLNKDGEALIKGYRYSWKKDDEASDDLTDKAMDMGYLKDGGTIRLTVDSRNEKWRQETEDRIVLELEIHTGKSVKITTDPVQDEPKKPDPILSPHPDSSVPAFRPDAVTSPLQPSTDASTADGKDDIDDDGDERDDVNDDLDDDGREGDDQNDDTRDDDESAEDADDSPEDDELDEEDDLPEDGENDRDVAPHEKNDDEADQDSREDAASEDSDGVDEDD
ncbi:hypothetical protein SAMN05216343_106129 [Oscillibacter sp. PC13]|uniref:anti-sigma-I factor RsgI family protein n=1 Tax=Oscillibacter sp. PC13 TaxID=1855299 RepID=UPI0008F16478|nr:hypothetical protein [Oscillibacter sp. PC13]SFP36452.1 hypothetical protein SAMN05216343_106129 [Oscillibacter sp. PC13]